MKLKKGIDFVRGRVEGEDVAAEMSTRCGGREDFRAMIKGVGS